MSEDGDRLQRIPCIMQLLEKRMIVSHDVLVG